MNKRTLERLMRDVPSWNYPGNSGAREAFVDTVTGGGKAHQYDAGQCRDAWELFLTGWQMSHE